MDKRTFTAFLLIGLVFLLWSTFFSPKPTPPAEGETTAAVETPAETDTDAPIDLDEDDDRPATQEDTADGNRNAGRAVDPDDPWSRYRRGGSQDLVIRTHLYEATLNSEGARLYRFTLADYHAWYGAPVQLIEDSTGFGGVLGVTLYRGSEAVPTDDLTFSFDRSGTIELGPTDSVVIVATLSRPAAAAATGETAEGEDAGETTDAGQSPAPTDESGAITKRFVFRGGTYTIGLDVEAPGSDRIAVDWTGGLKYQEHSSVDESNNAKAFVMIDEELEELDADVDEPAKSASYTGPIEWTGTKTKYFAAALFPQTATKAKATVTGSAAPADSSGLIEDYAFSLSQPTGNGPQAFTLFLGPLEFDLAREYGLTGMVDYGFMEFLIRPISEYVLLPLFRFLHGFIDNWGLVIIVFSILIRLALWPLSIPQIRSSEKMRLVQPLMTELREKHKDEPQKAQMETMKLYREYGVNPAGGCLPLLLQLPILYALWTTLANAIDLRQADFILWIHDLSVPDILVELPFSLPLVGDQLSGLALIMGTTLFIQQKLMITDPKQKMIVYIMPVFLTIAFNYFPAGLNLYYLTYNLLSIGQHYYMRNVRDSGVTLEDLKAQAKNKKKGWLSSKLEEAQKMAEMQGRVPPGNARK